MIRGPGRSRILAALLVGALLLARPARAEEPTKAQVDAWIAQALHGTREERDRAVRMLAALGGDAIDRLFEAVRREARPAAVAPIPPAPVPSAPVPSAPARERRTVVYDLADLSTELSPEELSQLFQGDLEVIRHGTTWEVKASDADHAALRIRLAEARALHTPPPAPPEAPRTPEEPEGPSVGAVVDLAEVVFSRLPEEGILGPSKNGAPPPRVLSKEEEAGWVTTARGVPDAKVLVFPTVLIVAGGDAAEIGVHESLSYRQGVKRSGDTWTAALSTLDEGRDVRVAVFERPGGLRAKVTMKRTTVPRPMATADVRPTPDASPVQIDVPQWTTSTVTAAVDLPAEGGAVTIPMPGLASSPGELPVLFLRVTRQR